MSQNKRWVFLLVLLANLSLPLAPVLAANGTLGLAGFNQSAGSVSTNLISQDGSNANNVSVKLELLDQNGGVADTALTPGTDILHERPSTFSLPLKSGLLAGTYHLRVSVYNNSDKTLNAEFNDAGQVIIANTGTVTPVPPTPAPSPESNSQLSLVSLDQVDSLVTAKLISLNGANANNVTVRVQLVDSGGRVKEEAVFPGVNILHENPSTFSLRISSDLASGNYAARVAVNTSDNLLSALFANAKNIIVAAGDSSTPSVPVPPANSNSGSNPFAGQSFYVVPNGDASRQADAWRNSRPSDAALMTKIAQVPQAVWFGDWNGGNIEADVRNLVTTANQAGKYPVLVLYNIPGRDCGGYSAGGAQTAAAYQAWIQSVVRGLGSGRAAVVLEPDGLAALDCLSSGQRQERLDLLRGAANSLKAQGNISVYLDAGHSGWVNATEMANRLKQAGVGEADGFALNVSNFMATADNVNYGSQVSAAVGGKHFIVDTARNGNGANGSEWCNPSGRALGTPSTANTGNPLVDAYFWLKPPGESDGTCNGGPSAGVWWPDYALGLATRASW